MKKLLISIFTIASCMSFVSNSHALVEDTNCTVTNSDDDASSASYGSLRRKLDQGFNRPSNRFCMGEINFGAGKTFEIKLTSPMKIVGSGSLNITKADATSVTIDGTALGDDDCVLNLKDTTDTQNTSLTLTNITIKSKTRAKAICGTVTGSVPTIIAGDDQCNSATDKCCDANHKWQADGISCNDGNGATSNDVCTNHQCVGTAQQCPPNSECCNSSGQWQADGTSCDDGDANTAPDTCTAHQCAGTQVVPDCLADSTCCDNTGHYQAAGTACTDSNSVAGTCDGMSSTCTPGVTTQCSAGVDKCCDNTGHYQAAGTACTDSNSAAGTCNGTSITCTPNPVAECDAATTQCCDDTGHWEADGTSCEDNVASTTNDICTAHACAGTPGTTGGTVTPGSGNTPGTGTTPPDGSNTTPISLGGGEGGGCMLATSVSTMATLWIMILGMIPMISIRRKK